MDVHLELEKLTALRVLGRGAMGTVFLVADRSHDYTAAPPRLFALKVVPKHPCPAAKPADAARRARWEVSVLARLSHPFLPSLLGHLETPDLLAWALPYCPGGDLNALRHSHSADGVFSPSATRFYLCEVLLALSHLHSLGIVYRDLKPENVLVQASGHLLLTDFDLSRHLPPRPPTTAAATSSSSSAVLSPPAPDKRTGRNKPKPKSARVSPANRRRSSADGGGGGDDSPGAGERSNSFVGTEEYVAPEVLRGDGHGFAVDWWALGVLAYEMAYGRTPFRGRTREETFANILTRRPEFAGGRRSDLTDLVEGLLAKDPALRLGSLGGAEEVKAHPFFLGVRWELLAEVARPPFLAPCDDDDDEGEHARSPPSAASGFSVADYFKKLQQQQAPTAPGSPPPSPSTSLAEF